MKINHFYWAFLLICSLPQWACKKDDTPAQPAAVSLYFPAANPSATWDTSTPEQLGWTTAKLPDLYAYLEQTNTRGFLVLKDGKIVIEKYFGKDLLGNNFTTSSVWYWASAGKTLTSFLVGKALEEKKLTLNQKSSDFLGTGWSSLTPQQEGLINVRHHLTMTTGLDDKVSNLNCTKPECLKFLTAPNTRWSYHNAPYTILEKVITGATKEDFNTYFNSRLRDKIGMEGFWRYETDNNIYYSTPRSMARFGLLVLAKGKWDKQVILGEENYYNEMINTSQNINLSYGYLWWLNGKASCMVPGSQTVFPRSLAPNAPADLVAAMGRDGQIIDVIPSQNLIVVRMGNNPDNSLVPINYHDELWAKLKEIIDKK